jgi:hypothetical protein
MSLPKTCTLDQIISYRTRQWQRTEQLTLTQCYQELGLTEADGVRLTEQVQIIACRINVDRFLQDFLNGHRVIKALKRNRSMLSYTTLFSVT